MILRTLGEKAKTPDIMQATDENALTYMKESLEYVKTLKARSLFKKHKGAPKVVVSFLEQCFEINPAARKTAEELIEHELFQDIRNKTFEPSPSQRITCPLDTLKDEEYSLKQIYKYIAKLVKKIKSADGPAVDDN